MWMRKETTSVFFSGDPFELPSDEDMTASGAEYGFSPADNSADFPSPSPYSPSYSPHSSLSPPRSPTDYSPTSPHS